MFYAGIDAHRNSSRIWIVDRKGRKVSSSTVEGYAAGSGRCSPRFERSGGSERNYAAGMSAAEDRVSAPAADYDVMVNELVRLSDRMMAVGERIEGFGPEKIRFSLLESPVTSTIHPKRTGT